MKLKAHVTLNVEDQPTANASLAGPGPRKICGVAIFRAEDGSFYVLSCDSSWQVMFDSNHQSLDEAIRSVDQQYPGYGMKLKMMK